MTENAQNLSRQQASAQNQADFDESMNDGTTTSVKVAFFIPLDPAPVVYRDPDVWWRRVGFAARVVSAAFVAYLGWQIVRWVL